MANTLPYLKGYLFTWPILRYISWDSVWEKEPRWPWKLQALSFCVNHISFYRLIHLLANSSSQSRKDRLIKLLMARAVCSLNRDSIHPAGLILTSTCFWLGLHGSASGLQSYWWSLPCWAYAALCIDSRGWPARSLVSAFRELQHW